MTPEIILKMEQEKLAGLIRPSGYFNQKARKLKEISRFFLETDPDIPGRDALLEIWGIGPETADSILLYAYKQPFFVVDAYTRRILERLDFISGGYGAVQSLFHRNMEPDYRIYNEFHALFVHHAKEFCRKAPMCGDCPLSGGCTYFSSLSA